MTEVSVRGTGRARAGATDTTMLIWKVIAANPGITRQGIWERVEHGIPEGYALRVYAAQVKYQERRGRPPGRSSGQPDQARRYVLTHALGQMRRLGVVAWEGDGNSDRRYTVARELRYKGNADAIDETGTKAAEHMAAAEALRAVEKMLARAKPGGHGPAVCANRKEYEALTIIVKALRTKGSTSG